MDHIENSFKVQHLICNTLLSPHTHRFQGQETKFLEIFFNS